MQDQMDLMLPMAEYHVRRGSVQPYAGNEQHRQMQLDAADYQDLDRQECITLVPLLSQFYAAEPPHLARERLHMVCEHSRDLGLSIGASTHSTILRLMYRMDRLHRKALH
jgi:hypothetical protein